MTTVAIVGLGYVGLPLVVAFGRQMRTIGFDISVRKVESCMRGVDPSGELEDEELLSADQAIYTSDPNVLGEADIVIVAVPWEGHRELLTELAPVLAGKVVIDCVNPLGFDKQGAYPLKVEEGSAAEQAAAVLPESRVVAAFHHVSAVLLLDEAVDTVDTDVLVLGDDREATDVVQALAERITGMRGIFAGRLRNAGQVEAMTANLISINRRYKAHAGLRVTDV